MASELRPPVHLSIIFPAYQEEAFLPTAVNDVVHGLRSRGETFEVLIVENGSRDQTRAVADRLAGEFPEVRSLSVSTPDYGKALRHGLLEATGEYIVNFDVDLYDLEFSDRAVARMSDAGGPSIIVASKRGDMADDTRVWYRQFVTGVFSTILRVGFGLKVSDTHGMKAMRRLDVQKLGEDCVFGTDLFDTELILRAERAGLPTGEIGVKIVETRPARTPILRRIVRSLRGLAKLWWVLRREARQLGASSSVGQQAR
jgi:glycosyltransferase AglD